MGRNDWFRNTTWDSEIEAAFMAKLRRARDKAQHLRIQACTLARSRPEIALRLLDEYFALGEHFDNAQGHVDRATAYLALRNRDAAIAAYEAALKREHEHPNQLTRACLDLPALIATQRLTAHYGRALQLIRANTARQTFPRDRFLAHGAAALILHEQGHSAEARASAQLALAAASEKHSGFRNHPDVGLVEAEDAAMRRRLEAIAA